jgi:hypothetical protein
MKNLTGLTESYLLEQGELDAQSPEIHEKGYFNHRFRAADKKCRRTWLMQISSTFLPIQIYNFAKEITEDW